MKTSKLLDGLTFPEGPRWHDGRLVFSDFYDGLVVAVDPEGQREDIVSVPQQPSGLGWDPAGRLHVVSMKDQRLLRMDGDELREVADLSGLATHFCNDMVMSASGHAYIGNFGFDLEAGAEPVATSLIHVNPIGVVSVAADDVMFPNGTVITPAGDTLILAETFASRLTAFRIEGDGSLTDRREWAALGDGIPDGICLDAEGAIWVADPRANEVFRVTEGGQVTDRISTGELGAFACMLGGEDRRTLYVCTAAGSGSTAASQRSGCIEQVRVAVPGAGLP